LWFAQDKKEEICAGDPDDIASLPQTAKDPQTGKVMLLFWVRKGRRPKFATSVLVPPLDFFRLQKKRRLKKPCLVFGLRKKKGRGLPYPSWIHRMTLTICTRTADCESHAFFVVCKGERSGVCSGYPGYGRQIFTNCERAADCEYLTLIEDLEGKNTRCAQGIVDTPHRSSSLLKKRRLEPPCFFSRNAQENKKEVAPFITCFFPPSPPSSRPWSLHHVQVDLSWYMLSAKKPFTLSVYSI
jgi:hypothetical protein